MAKKRDLTYKEKAFVSNFTNEKNPETFLNATKSALKAYNTNYEGARKLGSEKLTKQDIKEAIERKIRTKEDDQHTLQRFTDKLDAQLRDGTISPENSVLLRELREFIKLQGQFRGDFVEKSMNVNVNVNVDDEALASRAIEALQRHRSGGGEGV